VRQSVWVWHRLTRLRSKSPMKLTVAKAPAAYRPGVRLR